MFLDGISWCAFHWHFVALFSYVDSDGEHFTRSGVLHLHLFLGVILTACCCIGEECGRHFISLPMRVSALLCEHCFSNISLSFLGVLAEVEEPVPPLDYVDFCHWRDDLFRPIGKL